MAAGQGGDKGEVRGANKNRLFVGDLPPDTTAEELQNIFSPFGAVQNCRIMDKKVYTRDGKACGFVDMATENEACMAISQLNEVYKPRPNSHPIVVRFADKHRKGTIVGSGGRSFSVDQLTLMTPNQLGQAGLTNLPPGSPANGRLRLFVGNLPANVDRSKLEQIFGMYGKVLGVEIAASPVQGQSIAIVEFVNPAQEAINALNGLVEMESGCGAMLVRYDSSPSVSPGAIGMASAPIIPTGMAVVASPGIAMGIGAPGVPAIGMGTMAIGSTSIAIPTGLPTDMTSIAQPMVPSLTAGMATGIVSDGAGVRFSPY
eukprot:gnl/TRDRNA2_/TRDRNA2_141970_c0_seq1.p1 gnl/TRDRNA2_/TRDRNA2_141970_c0~~gnl/TRDRNA2_/TRDRNA2_141970_c0_seq1.p1  ORF type:complete len:316 (-),score=34.29 gnl/TRDRNA2_/TRDRNA2_141970_c0_seq1:8-955(-)